MRIVCVNFSPPRLCVQVVFYSVKFDGLGFVERCRKFAWIGTVADETACDSLIRTVSFEPIF